MKRSLILLALVPASLCIGENWHFGDSLELAPRAVRWSELSVQRRPIHLAHTQTQPFRFRFARHLLGLTLELERVPRSDLFERPGDLADLRGGNSWDDAVDRHGFWDAALFDTGLPGIAPPAQGEKLAMMFCTVYYTPLEAGFTAERGFDVTPETRPGLGGRRYSHDFLRAVIVEGFGRLAEPVGGKHYIKYDGRWGFSERILGNRNNTLVDRKSAAAYRRNPWMTKGARLTILDPEVFAAMGSMEWRVADTGGGLHRWQVDLYWGEDYPLGPGLDRFRPASCPLAVKFWLPVAISSQ